MNLARLARAAAAFAGRYRACDLCPRRCGVDRTAGERGFCGTLDRAPVAASGPHSGEERCLSGTRGSGTVFFKGCNLRCAFCQNADLSMAESLGDRSAADGLDPTALAAVFLRLARIGCHNLNLVTPTHVAPTILAALALAAEQGFALPVVWNCGGYESVDVIEALDGVVDIYLPDLKFRRAETAGALAAAPDYWERMTAAVRRMQAQVGDLVIDGEGHARSGMIFRHLVMPAGRADSPDVLAFIRSLSDDPYVNVMDQYRPCGDRSKLKEYALDAPLAERDYYAALEAAEALGIRNERGRPAC